MSRVAPESARYDEDQPDGRERRRFRVSRVHRVIRPGCGYPDHAQHEEHNADEGNDPSDPGGSFHSSSRTTPTLVLGWPSSAIMTKRFLDLIGYRETDSLTSTSAKRAPSSELHLRA